MLNGQSRDLSSRLDLEPSKIGDNSSKNGRSLNPLFVEFLMGWPVWWTMLVGFLSSSDTALIGSECSVTGLFHYKRRMRSAFWRLDLPAPPKAQPDLFG